MVCLEQMGVLGRHFKAGIHRLKDQPDRQGSVIENAPNQLFGFGQKLVRREHLVDQSYAPGLLGVDHLSSQQQFQRATFSDQSGQPDRSAVAGTDSQFHFRLAEFRVLAGEPQVARHRQLTTPTQGETVYRRDDGFAQPFDPTKHRLPLHCAGFPIEWALPGQISDVGSGDERLGTSTGQDHAANRPIGLHGSDRQPQLGDDGVVQRVELVGAVDGDEGDAFADFE
jgi:hypothetical protein